MSRRPNILLIMPDQLRADALGCAGHPVFQTPNIDRLAREGVCFTHAYANSPLCMPARASLISGQYPHNHHIHGNGGCLPADDETCAQLLRQAGYRTAYIGKIHYFPDTAGRSMIEHEPYVRARGFDYVHEVPGPGAMTKTDNYLSRRWKDLGLLEQYQEDYQRRARDSANGGAAAWPSPLPEDEFLDRYVGARAVEWLQAYEEEMPFCLWVGFGGPHPPWDAPEPYASMYDPDSLPDPIPAAEPGDWVPVWAREQMERKRNRRSTPDLARRRMASYGGKVTLVDRWIGRLLDVLDARGWTENTLVVFLSDHGEMGGDHQRYQKEVFYESSARVPLIVRWPELATAQGGKGLPQGRCLDHLVEQIDVFDTLIEAGEAPAPRYSFGRSLVPLARGDVSEHRDAVFSEVHRCAMIRTPRYKYAIDPQGRGFLLHDLHDDPTEQRNLIGHPDWAAVERDLRDRLLVWFAATQIERTEP